jgi:hypothetical protein
MSMANWPAEENRQIRNNRKRGEFAARPGVARRSEVFEVITAWREADAGGVLARPAAWERFRYCSESPKGLLAGAHRPMSAGLPSVDSDRWGRYQTMSCRGSANRPPRALTFVCEKFNDCLYALVRDFRESVPCAMAPLRSACRLQASDRARSTRAAGRYGQLAAGPPGRRAAGPPRSGGS